MQKFIVLCRVSAAGAAPLLLRGTFPSRPHGGRK